MDHLGEVFDAAEFEADFLEAGVVFVGLNKIEHGLYGLLLLVNVGLMTIINKEWIDVDGNNRPIDGYLWIFIDHDNH